MNPVAISLIGLSLFMGPKDYPLEVRILHVHAHTNKHHYTVGEGIGDIVVPGRGQVGFDYTFEGCETFEPTRGTDRLMGRWKEEPHRLDVMMPEVGSDKLHQCTLKVTLKDYRYALRDGKIVSEPFQPEKANP